MAVNYVAYIFYLLLALILLFVVKELIKGYQSYIFATKLQQLGKSILRKFKPRRR